MLVLDMDDTLLTDDHKISKRNKDMIFEAQKKGVYIALASGRPTSAMTSFACELQLDITNAYMISFNGAQISTVKTNDVFFKQTLSKQQIHDLYTFSKSHNTHIITYLNDCIISETNCEYIEIEKTITGLPHVKVNSFIDAVTTDAVKCILLEEPNYLKKIEKKLQLTMPHLSVSMSKPFFLEVAQKGIDKGASLKLLAQHLNFKQSEIIAVGNAGNDLSMIEYAGLGVWVENVATDLKEKANIVVASNNNDGVAEVIEKFILNL